MNIWDVVKIVLFCVLFFIWFFSTKQIVYWETICRLGYKSEAPEYFLKNPYAYYTFHTSFGL